MMAVFPPRSRFRLALPLILLAAACTDGGEPTGPDGLSIQPSVIIDYQAGSGDQFAFLEPLVAGDPAGPLAMGLHPLISICNTSPGEPGTDCTVLEAEETGNHYQANWKDKTAEPDEMYTISVSTSFGLRIGELRLFLDGLSGDKAGRTFPIKFWIGEGLGDLVVQAEECIGDPRCNSAAVPASMTETSVVTTEDEDGEVMAALTFPVGSVPAGGLVVTLDCRTAEEGGFAPGQGPLPTALNQWPMFCHIDARNPDGNLFLGTLASPANLDICVVDETLGTVGGTNQGDYHGFVDHDELVLGKSSGPGNFEILTPGTTTLDCVNNTYIAMGDEGSPFDAIGSRFASALGFFMPQPLRAAPMRFRDGGVGGQLGSFSDINPVEPAYIHGTVTHGEVGGVAGVTVTLSGDGSAMTTTDASGNYTLGPLQAAVSGSSYTVTVSDLPAWTVMPTSSQAVAVGGSGTFTADFQTVDPYTGVYLEEEYPVGGGYNCYHSVTITRVDETTLLWTNSCPITWTLTATGDAAVWDTGPDSPYYASPFNQFTQSFEFDLSGTAVVARGPFNEPYTRQTP